MITNLIIQIYFTVSLLTLDMKTETNKAQSMCQTINPKARIIDADIDITRDDTVRLVFTCQGKQ